MSRYYRSTRIIVQKNHPKPQLRSTSIMSLSSSSSSTASASASATNGTPTPEVSASHTPASSQPPSSSATPANTKTTTKPERVNPNSSERFGWPISSRIVPEIAKAFDVWTVFSPLSGYVPKDSLNLGQGFMNWSPPEFVQKAAIGAIGRTETNHYSVARGRMRLRQALSEYVSDSYKLEGGRKLDPNTEILVTAGANEGMYAFAAAFLQPKDEVILFEPYFDQYTPQVKFNDGVPVYVPIRAPERASHEVVSAEEWKVDIDELRKAITSKTKMIWINTPHNPIGKVFDESELRAIGQVAEEFDLLICADEVYDCLTFGGKQHVRIASLDDFWRRTITVGSAGKSFSATGWRIGWCVGPAHLIQPTLAASTRIVFACNSPAQEATAIGIEEALLNGFFPKQVTEYTERRKVLLEGLDKLGLPYTIPDGAYFVLVNTERLEIPEDFVVPDMIKHRARDWKAAWFIAQTAGVVLIPPTDFYSEDHWDLGSNFIRVAFCKDLQTLRDAGERLLKLKPFIRPKDP